PRASVDSGHAAAVLALARGRARPETQQASAAGGAGTAALAERAAGRLAEAVVTLALAATRVRAGERAAAGVAGGAGISGQTAGLHHAADAGALHVARQRRVGGEGRAGEAVAAGPAAEAAAIPFGGAPVDHRVLGPLRDVVGGVDVLEGKGEGRVAPVLIVLGPVRIDGRHPQQRSGSVTLSGRRLAQAVAAGRGEGEPVEPGLGAVAAADL